VTIPDPSNKKHELRLKIRRRLRELPPDSARVCEATRRWLAARPELRTVALYAALAEEVDLLPLVAWDPSRRWVFPRICGEDLAFHEVRDVASDLLRGSAGIREPSPALPQVQVAEVDVFLCPGLAFDANGGRLGRGRGFYDRMLANARPDAIKLGVCHPAQRVADTFPQAHDAAMDEVIS
jgi:5-formyltetrahydrofolate cyclo-ligase